MESTLQSPRPSKSLAGNDDREALFNSGEIGPIEHIQVSTERITQLRGILFDIDPKLLLSGPLTAAVPDDPQELYAAVVSPLLDRHPVLQKAEVRNSGTGLHVILQFDKPVEFNTGGERDRWNGIIKVIQAMLPSDPDAPAITAVTRPIDSVNSKNGARVRPIKSADPVTADEVVGLFEKMSQSPFSTVLKVLTGTDKVSPCPVCREHGTHLKAMDFCGQCYGSCGKVQLGQLYDLVLSPRSVSGKEVASDVTRGK